MIDKNIVTHIENGTQTQLEQALYDNAQMVAFIAAWEVWIKTKCS
jgi:hypothetical protein